jgi:hypothetical protein
MADAIPGRAGKFSSYETLCPFWLKIILFLSISSCYHKEKNSRSGEEP